VLAALSESLFSIVFFLSHNCSVWTDVYDRDDEYGAGCGVVRSVLPQGEHTQVFRQDLGVYGAGPVPINSLDAATQG